MQRAAHDSSILADRPPLADGKLRAAIRARHVEDENRVSARLLGSMQEHGHMSARVQAKARELALRLREESEGSVGVEAFMHAYALDTREGVLLMCLAEALLRVPDEVTQEELIRDKLQDAQWQSRVGASKSFLLNASAYGLILSGTVMRWDAPDRQVPDRLKGLIGRLGEPVVREAMRRAMGVMGKQFVLGQTIDQAIDRAKRAEKLGRRYSYDMLGEAALTAGDAQRYFESYRSALQAIAKAAKRQNDPNDRPSLSVKLSALHPRYETAKWQRLHGELLPRIKALCLEAKGKGVALTIDAEEADRLEISLDLFEALASDPELQGWQGLGLAVQAYQKRALPVIAWLQDLARRTGRRFPVRLVKGAYWDTEIKHAQQEGLSDYPVFTRKLGTDVSYLACADALLEGGEAFYPQFATHNAHTLAWVLERAGNRRGFEFQKLHGMGDSLYDQLNDKAKFDAGVPVRVYAPVGGHKDLLPYLVRRLLENGANSSFVHQVVSPGTSIEELVADPVERLSQLQPLRQPKIPKPLDIFGSRLNAAGIDLNAPAVLDELARRLGEVRLDGMEAVPEVEGATGAWTEVRDPADGSRILGRVMMADAQTAARAVDHAAEGFKAWAATPVAERARILRKAADLMEGAHRDSLIALCVREAGKSLRDTVADLREAVDFLRYYADEAERLMAAPVELPGVTGESNTLKLVPRGVFACIAPWNFPIAIFTGQAAAALAAGNAVVAKPAEQTTLTGTAVTCLLHEAGVPDDALVLLPAVGHEVGDALVTHPKLAGVAFTGSNAAATAINRAMANSDLPIRPLIAETGGINALVVDSSALIEQAVADSVESAFRSAGQRCSALRMVCVQEDAAPRFVETLKGAMDQLAIGDPGLLSTDVGPVIDDEAADNIKRHVQAESSRVTHRVEVPGGLNGSFVEPTLIRLGKPEDLDKEVFGPVLHLVTWKAGELDKLIERINASGYGLTFGVHSRIDTTINRAVAKARAGNVYVNRNIIGAVVGSQPFGGEGRSGTGFKAGGPHYLLKFCAERAVANNTAAVGGNLALLAQDG